MTRQCIDGEEPSSALNPNFDKTCVTHHYDTHPRSREERLGHDHLVEDAAHTARSDQRRGGGAVHGCQFGNGIRSTHVSQCLNSEWLMRQPPGQNSGPEYSEYSAQEQDHGEGTAGDHLFSCALPQEVSVRAQSTHPRSSTPLYVPLFHTSTCQQPPSWTWTPAAAQGSGTRWWPPGDRG